MDMRGQAISRADFRRHVTSFDEGLICEAMAYFTRVLFRALVREERGDAQATTSRRVRLTNALNGLVRRTRVLA